MNDVTQLFRQDSISLIFDQFCCVPFSIKMYLAIFLSAKIPKNTFTEIDQFLAKNCKKVLSRFLHKFSEAT